MDERDHFFGVGFFGNFSAKFAPVFSLAHNHSLLSELRIDVLYGEQVPCHNAKLLMARG
jgi:hypothetical protein